MKIRYKKHLLDEREFVKAVDLEQKLRDKRLTALDYLLARASYSLDRGERNAWYSIYKLIGFVEKYKRYPKKSEQAELFKVNFEFAEELNLTADEFGLMIEKDLKTSHKNYEKKD